MAGRPRKRGVAPPLPPSVSRGHSYGTSAHDSNCKCPRCVGFQEGNEWRFAAGHSLSTTHGAYAIVSISKEAEEVADRIRAVVPAYAAADEPAVRVLAIVCVRIQRAEAALEELEELTKDDPLAMYSGELELNGKTVRVQGLKDDLRGWLTTAERYFSQLGMTPASRWKLGLDIVRAQRGLTVLDLHAEEEVA